MGVIYLFLKLYPFFGIALAVLSIDFARNFKRKGNRAWVGMVIFCVLFIFSSGVWIFYRGDRNADRWWSTANSWINGR